MLQTFYEWPKWPGLLHSLFFALILYSIYVFVVSPTQRTLTNVLLFTLVIGVDIVSH